VLADEVFVLEFLSVYAFPSRSLRAIVNKELSNSLLHQTYIAPCKVTTLKHEIRYHAVKLRPFVAKAHLPSTQRCEVLDRLWHDIVVQHEVDATTLPCSGLSQNLMQWRRDGSYFVDLGQ
jgi:hypothetical protein